ncbi:MAG: alpha/beta fold hydrolase, partial [Cyanobacteria bacterium J06650_10]
MASSVNESVSTGPTESLVKALPSVHASTWQWKGFDIGYQYAVTEKADAPAVIMIHGFGASSIHWRKNIPELAAQYRVYAIDLIGYGKSAKPSPGEPLDYTFETWGQQVLDFCQQVVGQSAFLVANS